RYEVVALQDGDRDLLFGGALHLGDLVGARESHDAATADRELDAPGQRLLGASQRGRSFGAAEGAGRAAHVSPSLAFERGPGGAALVSFTSGSIPSMSAGSSSTVSGWSEPRVTARWASAASP